MKKQSRLIRFLLASATFAVAVPAIAQWQWIDKDGRKVFSDQAPPADIKDKEILKRPGGRVSTPLAVAALAGAALPGASAALPSASAASAPKLPAKETDLEARKKQSEKDEALLKKSEQDKQAKIRQENCDRAKVALVTLQSGIRIATVNTAGEREVMSDTKRVEETKRAKDTTDNDCKK